ncbi:MAG TPA: vWA domain-containing protein [Polyangiaceae bacterium]|nr:vWA domain-containing protein [Polyangiaceae bacterium]
MSAGFSRVTWVLGGLCLALSGQSCGSASDGDGVKPTGGSAGLAGRTGTGGSTSAGGFSESGGVRPTGGSAGSSTGGEAIGTAGAAGDTDLGGGGGASRGGSGGAGESPGTGGLVVIGNGGSSGAVGACVGASFRVTPLPPVLEFLVDTSISMREKAPNAAVTKWQVTTQALLQAFDELPDGSGVGLIFFPNTNTPVSSTSPCIQRKEAVAIASLDSQLRTALTAALTAVTPFGATPTHDALRYAIETLASSKLPGDPYVVLVTDGAPTYALECMGDGMTPADPAPLLLEVGNAWTTHGIRTFVIGSPGSESARGTLSQMATLGHTAAPGCSDQGPSYCHFDMTTSADLGSALTAALTSVTDTTRGCSYGLPTPSNGGAIDIDKVNVTLTSAANSVPLSRASGASGCTRGWQYDPSATHIVLCSETCALTHADPTLEVEVVLGCTTITQ